MIIITCQIADFGAQANDRGKNKRKQREIIT